MGFHQPLVAEDGDAGDGVHVLGMQEVDELRQIMECAVVAAQQRMVEGDGDAAVAVLDIEDHGVAAHFTPARMMRMPWSLAAMIPVRYTARTSKSRATGTDFSTIGAGSSPGMITGWPAFRNVPWKSPLASRIASLSSVEVRYEVCDR